MAEEQDTGNTYDTPYSGNWVNIIADLVGTYFGFKEAQDKSGNFQSPRDQFQTQNPDYANPFRSRLTDYNDGDPRITEQFSPQVTQMIEEWIARGQKAGGGREPYGMPDGMRDMYGAQQNWQRERMGLPPVDRPEKYTPYADSGGSDQSDALEKLVDEITLMNPDEWAFPEDSGGGDDPFDLTGFPSDYLNDKGNVRRKYRPDNKWYVGDEEMRRWKEDEGYEGAVLPDDYFNDKGLPRRRYRDDQGGFQEYYSNEQNPDVAIFGTGTGAPEDWLNDKGNIRRRYREGSNQYGGDEFQNPDWIQPEDWLNNKGNVRRKYRAGE